MNINFSSLHLFHRSLLLSPIFFCIISLIYSQTEAQTQTQAQAQANTFENSKFIITKEEKPEDKIKFEIELEELENHLDPTTWEIDPAWEKNHQQKKLEELNINFYKISPAYIKKFDPGQKQERYMKLKPQIAMLKKNALLYDVENNEPIRSAKERYVIVRINAVNTHSAEILDKNNIPKYNTHFNNIVLLENDLDLSAKPENFITYDEKSRPALYDKNFEIHIFLSGHREFLTPDYFSSFFNSEIYRAEGYRLEVRPSYRAFSRINLGLSLSQSKGTITTENNNHFYHSWYLGPIIEHHSFTLGQFQFISNIGLQKSIKYSMTGPIADFYFKQSVFQLGMEMNLPIKKGELSIGLTYRLMKTNYNDNQPAWMETPATHTSDYSVLGFGVGYRFGHLIL